MLCGNYCLAGAGEIHPDYSYIQVQPDYLVVTFQGAAAHACSWRKGGKLEGEIRVLLMLLA